MSKTQLSMVLSLGFLMIVVMTAGCGGRPSRVKISGTVTIDGNPLEHGGISFKPTAGGRAAGGAIEKGGAYMASMYTENDGLPVGTYTVAIDAAHYINDTAKKWHAPKRYSVHSTSELTVEITEERSDLKFELTWEGDDKGKPWVEKLR